MRGRGTVHKRGDDAREAAVCCSALFVHRRRRSWEYPRAIFFLRRSPATVHKTLALFLCREKERSPALM